MKFTYRGPEGSVTVFGVTFQKNVAVDVADAKAIAKLSAHPEFEAEKAPAQPVKDGKNKG